jgi:hypothetical protein
MNCTLATPAAEVAFAVTVTDPFTVAPANGAVIATVGALPTVTITAADVAV